ncbi:MAG: hypothetical protein HYY93_06310 [Planctomycetes bacterium]|nr:hypothetical protein [Planctomycetota bacterium]
MRFLAILSLPLVLMASAGCAGRDRLRAPPLELGSPLDTYRTLRNALAHNRDLPRAYACLTAATQAAYPYRTAFVPAMTRSPDGLLFRRLIGEAEAGGPVVDETSGKAMLPVMIRGGLQSFNLVREKIPADGRADPGVLPEEGWRLDVVFETRLPAFSKLVRPEEKTPEAIRQWRERFEESRVPGSGRRGRR